MSQTGKKSHRTTCIAGAALLKMFRKTKGFFYFQTLRIKCRKWHETVSHVTLNGLDLVYSVRGPENGKPVILLHGNGGSHKSMVTQQLELAQAGYRVFCPDSRGQGANPPLDEYHYADMAEDTFQFIKAFNLDKPLVGGHSDGGIIALMLEMSHPGTCSSIVAAGANIYPDDEGEGFEEFKKWILEQGTPLLMMMLEEPDIKPQELAAIKCPALIIAGSRDMISEQHTRLIAESIPGSELVIVDGADHFSYLKRNPLLGRRMLDFMKRHGY